MNDERYQLFYEKITSLQPEEARSVDEVEYLMYELQAIIAVISDYIHNPDSTPGQLRQAEKLEDLIKENLKSLILQTEVLGLLADIEHQLAN